MWTYNYVVLPENIQIAMITNPAISSGRKISKVIILNKVPTVESIIMANADTAIALNKFPGLPKDLSLKYIDREVITKITIIINAQ